MKDENPKRLDHQHRRTARAILSRPVGHNIEWRDALSLLQALGMVCEKHNGKLTVALGGETAGTLRRPSGKDLDEQTLRDLRRMLTAAGLTAQALIEHGEPDVRIARAERAEPVAGREPARDHGDGRWGEN